LSAVISAGLIVVVTAFQESLIATCLLEDVHASAVVDDRRSDCVVIDRNGIVPCPVGTSCRNVLKIDNSVDVDRIGDNAFTEGVVSGEVGDLCCLAEIRAQTTLRVTIWLNAWQSGEGKRC